MAAKRKLSALAPTVEEPVDPADELMFLCLGGGNEVGRSCHIIQYKGKTIMVRLSYGGIINTSILMIFRGSSMLDSIPLTMVSQPCHTLTSLI